MTQVCVIIPFFQREAGILRRALVSILGQELPAATRVQVIVVDDGSPVPAATEADGLDFSGAFALRIIPKANGGVGAARNTALDAVDAATDVVAFLDSDDSWDKEHLALGLSAIAQGADFYFCDNAREGHHLSHFTGDKALILPFIDKAADKGALIPIGASDMSTLILRDFPCQLSTTMFRYAIARDLRFDSRMRNAGEDVIFFLNLVPRTRKICFSARTMVTCGKGINLYFSNMGWGCEGYLKRLLDDTKAHQALSGSGLLSADDLAWNTRYVREHRQQVVFYCLRSMVKNKGALPLEIKALAKQDRSIWLWFPFWAVYVVLGRAFGFYKPF